MKIAIDASQLVEHNMVGTQVYLYNLIHNLALIDKTNEYIVYFKNEVSGAFFNDMVNGNVNFSYRCLQKRGSWTQVSLAHALYLGAGFGKSERYTGVNVLLCPWQTMPIIHPRKTKVIGIIHAVGEYKKWSFMPTLYTCWFADKIIAVSQFTKKRILNDFWVLPGKVVCVYESVDTGIFYKRSTSDVFEVRKKFDLPEDYIYFVGTAFPRKNLERMFKAFAKIIESKKYSKDIAFVVGGKVPNEYKSIYDVPAALGISDYVKFIGHVAVEDSCRLLSGAKFLAYVSISEGFGLPTIEAMGCGTAVLTANTGALPEVTGDAAVLVSPFSEDAIYEGMLSLLDSNVAANYVKKGFKNVERFSWKKTAEGVLNVIKEYEK